MYNKKIASHISLLPPFRDRIPKLVWRGRTPNDWLTCGSLKEAAACQRMFLTSEAKVDHVRAYAAALSIPVAVLHQVYLGLRKLSVPSLVGIPVSPGAGQDSLDPRSQLVALSAMNPAAIDAASSAPLLPDLQHWTASQHTPLSDAEMLAYKYLIVLDAETLGTIGRTWGLVSGSLLFRPQTPLRHWLFGGMLEPMVHYVPLKADLSNTLEVISWAERESSQAESIVQNALKVGRGLGQRASLSYLAIALRTIADLPGSTVDEELFQWMRIPSDNVRSPDFHMKKCLPLDLHG